MEYFIMLIGMALVCAVLARARAEGEASPLPGTEPLEWTDDLASRLVAGADQFLRREIDRSLERRGQFWQRDTSSPESYSASVEPNRQRLAHILGVRDPRVPFAGMEWVGTTAQPALVGKGEGYQVFAVRWPAFGDVHGEGLLLVPTPGPIVADVVALPDADQTPEMIAGLTEGVPSESQFARRLAESGCRVLVPVLIDREITHRQLSNREFLYRSAFELGRHLIGYEVQKVLAGVDWFAREREMGNWKWEIGNPQSGTEGNRREQKGTEGNAGVCNPQSAIRNPSIGVMGWGEGGMLALYAGALDPRIDAVCVSGYFDSRQNVWQEPLYRNVFGLLEQFGDAEVASLIAPRTLVVEAAQGPEVTVPPGTGGGPGRLVTPKLEEVRQEVERARGLVGDGDFGVRQSLLPLAEAAASALLTDLGVRQSLLPLAEAEASALLTDFGVRQSLLPLAEAEASALPRSWLELVVSGDGDGPYGTDEALQKLLAALAPAAPPGVKGEPEAGFLRPSGQPPQHLRDSFDPAARQKQQFHEIDRHNQGLLSESPAVRQEFFAKLDTSSLDRFQEGIEGYRQFFSEEVIGRFDYALLPPHPRSRKAYDAEKWTGYEVVLDVWPDVIAYGILLLPKDLRDGERRPVVVCQHGLEGRPQDVVAGDSESYHDFAARLAERGFITFAPQNLYIFEDRFRTLQRKANPLKKTLFSLIVPQHQQITDWLKSLPYVDPERIAFYGLSYGGKTAMRVPPLVPNYCLSICSADFNEWVWKNASTRSPYSYVWTGEYEIFEFDLGSTFNYAEMAALIAPRPFMVERGHFDGVAPDETVAYEFAKVRFFYEARLGLVDQCEIEWFVGPHTINGQGTFRFLHRHLNWPEPKSVFEK